MAAARLLTTGGTGARGEARRGSGAPAAKMARPRSSTPTFFLSPVGGERGEEKGVNFSRRRFGGRLSPPDTRPVRAKPQKGWLRNAPCSLGSLQSWSTVAPFPSPELA